jgi:hypothetical protein
MKVLFAGQVPKDLSFPEDIEDVYKMATDLGRVAVSDGAGESYDSKTWAKLLTDKFVHHPELSENWLTEAVEDYLAKSDYSHLSWSKQAAFERGSFATLLCIEEFVELGTVDVLGVGDTVAILLDDNHFVDSFPYVCAEEFQQRPELFSTKAIHNSFIASPDFFSRHLKVWPITGRKAPIVLCMTDGLGEWALRSAQQGQPMWQILAEIKESSVLEKLVLQERKAKNMRIDDVTLVKLSFETGVKDELPDP